MKAVLPVRIQEAAEVLLRHLHHQAIVVQAVVVITLLHQDAPAQKVVAPVADLLILLLAVVPAAGLLILLPVVAVVALTHRVLQVEVPLAVVAVLHHLQAQGEEEGVNFRTNLALYNLIN